MGKSPEPGGAGSEQLSRRLAIGGGLTAALLIGSGAYVGLSRAHRHETDAPSFGGPFTLNDSNGPVSETTFRGRYMLVYFGYTFCPDVCPTTLNTMVQALGALGRRGDDVQVVFITVDPARDSPAVMHEYAQAISPRILGLTGTTEQIAQAAQDYHVYYRPHQSGPGDKNYAVDHSSIVYLQARDGAPLALIPADASADHMAAELAKYLT